ncbi:MAG TPA: hypothetical protein VGQ68_00615 [Gaiellaceae bacterium]|jgi:hypothetical protein|nr:hypothetical protein [Gaiellaceae bacterium]
MPSTLNSRSGIASNGARPRNLAARVSVLLGLLGLAAMPAAAAVTESREELRLVHAGAAVPVAGALALGALWSARRARRNLERTLGRVGGGRAALAGRILGWLALYLALVGAISLAVYAYLYYVRG